MNAKVSIILLSGMLALVGCEATPGDQPTSSARPALPAAAASPAPAAMDAPQKILDLAASKPGFKAACQTGRDAVRKAITDATVELMAKGEKINGVADGEAAGRLAPDRCRRVLSS